MPRATLVALLVVLAVGAVGTPARAQRNHVITPTSIGGIRVCEPLDSVAMTYPEARDTMIFGGVSQTRWPAKIISIGAGEWLTAEASWVDDTRVWRLSTNSPGQATAFGLRVGSSIADVVAAGERLTFGFPPGRLVARLLDARLVAELDDSSAARFYRRWSARGDPLRFVDRSARITLITISGSCPRRRAGH
jgi:hypothetical protein